MVELDSTNSCMYSHVIEDDGSETYVDLGTVPRTTTSLTNFEFRIPQSAFGKQAYLNLYNQQYTTATTVGMGQSPMAS